MTQAPDAPALAAGAAAFLLAGFAKGAVGFAFPMIAVSLLSLALPVSEAVAVSLLPTVAANLAQALQGGGRAALATLRRHAGLNVCSMLGVAVGAAIAPGADERALALGLGLATLGCAAWQAAGARLRLGWPADVAGAAAGATGGVFGGLIGFATPPILLYYAALPLAPRDFTRALGATFLVASAAAAAAHAGWGALDGAAALWGLLAAAPTALGLAVGAAAARRLDQARFHRLCLAGIVLCGGVILSRGLA